MCLYNGKINTLAEKKRVVLSVSSNGIIYSVDMLLRYNGYSDNTTVDSVMYTESSLMQ